MSDPEAEVLSARLLAKSGPFRAYPLCSCAGRCSARGWSTQTLVGSFPGCYTQAVNGHPAAAPRSTV